MDEATPLGKYTWLGEGATEDLGTKSGPHVPGHPKNQ